MGTTMESALHLGRAHALAIKLNRLGRRLLEALHEVPAKASFRLTDPEPEKAIRQRLRIR